MQRKFPIFLIFLALLGGLFLQTVTASAQNVAEIRAFQNVAPGQGWLWLGTQLFWTENDGRSWKNITPAQPGYEIVAVFWDSTGGKALLAGAQPGQFALATYRNPQTWDWSFFELSEVARWPAPFAWAGMGWQDERLGWLTFKMASGNNFSLGLLYLTLDGGQTWQARSLPVAGEVLFRDERHGWLLGGATGHDLFSTDDGGQTWQALKLAANASPHLPIFAEDRGYLPLLENGADSASLAVFSADSSASTWTLAGRTPLTVNLPPNAFLPSWRGADTFLLVLPTAQKMIRLAASGQVEFIPNEDGRAAQIVALEMVDAQTGWAQWTIGSCQNTGELQCERQTGLLVTRDGGRHWSEMPLPLSGQTTLRENFSLPAKDPAAAFSLPTTISDADTQAYSGQGFDVCEIPPLDQMQTWWDKSPYSAVNLYIGGAARLCPNTTLSASYLAQLNAQGWRFFPTWVGPQAPCTGFISTFDWDPAKAFNQGVKEANAALTKAQELGLTDTNQAGTVIYYDMEAYNTADSACRAAVNAFVNGWTMRMKALGNVAGVYGASCASAVSDWAGLTNVPDVIWIANWYGLPGAVSYRRTASVWNAACLSNTLWANHQRLRQYAGDHAETWGGLTFPDIDSDVLDGILTVPNGSANMNAPSQPTLLSPAEGNTLPRLNNVWLSWKTSGDSCTVQVWGGASMDITQESNCSLLSLGVLRGGTYSWQVTANNGAGTTIGPIWHFSVRPAGVTNLSATAVSPTAVDLRWTLSTDDPNDVDGYHIYVNGIQVASLGKGIASYRATGLSCGSMHTFAVQSVRQDIESNDPPLSAMTFPCEATFTSLGEFDGWVRESGEMSGRGGIKNTTNATFWLGDDALNNQYRAILHFDTSPLPDDAILVSVILKIKQYTIVGVNPFTTHRNIAVDIRSGYFFTDPTLQVEDFQALASKNRVALIKNLPINKWYSANLDVSAFPFINLSGPTQFRLRFVMDDDNDLTDDIIKFFSGNAVAANRPLLIIQYNLP